MRSQPPRVIAACALAALAAACAEPPRPAAGPPRACFLSRQVDGFAARGMDGVNLKVRQDYYALDFIAACPEADEALRIRLRPLRGGGAFICEGDQVNVVAYSRVTGPRTCLARSVRRMSPQEVAALPKGQRP